MWALAASALLQVPLHRSIPPCRAGNPLLPLTVPWSQHWCLQGGLGSSVPGGAALRLSEQLSSQMPPPGLCCSFQRALPKLNSLGSPQLTSKDGCGTSRQWEGKQGNRVLRGCGSGGSRDHRVPLGSALAKSGGGNTLNIWQTSALGGCSLLSRNAKVSAEGQGEPSLDLPSHPGLPFPFFLF